MSSYDPLTETTEAHQLGILAARGLTASRRSLSGKALDSIDLDALSRIAGILESSGLVAEYLTSGGQSGHGPSQLAASTFDVTIDAVMASKAATGGSLQDALREIAQLIYQFIKSPLDALASQLAVFFSLLVRAAANQSATPGETVLAL